MEPDGVEYAVMICAYCKSRVLESDRKCQACGSMVFVEEERILVSADLGSTAPVAEKPNDIQAADLLDEVIREALRQKPPRSSKNRWVTLVICILLGWVGVHRFYVGKIGTGMLFLFTGGLFGFGVLADALTILFGYFRDKEGLLLR